jgi:hypothetical protein
MGGTQRDGSKQKKVKRFACPLSKGTGRLFGSFLAIAGPLVGDVAAGDVLRTSPRTRPHKLGSHGTETCPLVPMFGHRRRDRSAIGTSPRTCPHKLSQLQWDGDQSLVRMFGHGRRDRSAIGLPLCNRPEA